MRKASAYADLWRFGSLLIGAFVASVMATFGGRQRDRDGQLKEDTMRWLLLLFPGAPIPVIIHIASFSH